MSLSNGAGLDISCGCYAGSRDNFDNLRLMLSQVAGYGIKDFRPQGGPLIPDLPWTSFSEEDLLGEWPNGAPDDPLIILLAHHENAGRIKLAHANFLADRLEQLEYRMKPPDATVTPVWVLLIQQFVRGLRYAVNNHMDVVFN